MKALLTVTLLMFTSAAFSADNYELINGVAALANDSVITMQEVNMASAQAMDLVRRTYYNDPQQLRTKSNEAVSDALEILLERQLILHEFTAQGGNLPENFIDDEIKDRIRQQSLDRATFIKNLQLQGMTFEAYRQRTREEIIISYMNRKNVSEALLISPAKIERFYQENLERYKLGDQIKLRMITLNRAAGASWEETKALAAEIRTKILEGASFAEMASSYSEGSQRKEGGLMGWIQESSLSPLSKLALTLAPGKCSDIIGVARESDDSYWIYEYAANGDLARGRKFTSRDVMVQEKKYGPGEKMDPGAATPQSFYLMTVDERQVAHTRKLTEVRDEIEKELLLVERSRLKKKWIERLRVKSYVTYF